MCGEIEQLAIVSLGRLQASQAHDLCTAGYVNQHTLELIIVNHLADLLERVSHLIGINQKVLMNANALEGIVGFDNTLKAVCNCFGGFGGDELQVGDAW